MTELDLHGLRHEDVKKTLEYILNGMWNSEEELHIITGHSEKMKNLVIDILVEYGLTYTIGDWAGINTGYIRTILE